VASGPVADVALHPGQARPPWLGCQSSQRRGTGLATLSCPRRRIALTDRRLFMSVSIERVNVRMSNIMRLESKLDDLLEVRREIDVLLVSDRELA